jgi:hypothetical protein
MPLAFVVAWRDLQGWAGPFPRISCRPDADAQDVVPHTRSGGTINPHHYL